MTGITSVAVKTLRDKINGDLVGIEDLKNGKRTWSRKRFRGNKTTQIELFSLIHQIMILYEITSPLLPLIRC